MTERLFFLSASKATLHAAADRLRPYLLRGVPMRRHLVIVCTLVALALASCGRIKPRLPIPAADPGKPAPPPVDAAGKADPQVAAADQLDKDIRQINHGSDPGRTFALRRLSKYEAPVPERQAEVSRELWKSIEKDGQ